VTGVHEFGLCESILDAVEKRAAGRTVSGVKVRVGVLHRVDGPSFNQAFEMVSAGTVADRASLEMVTVRVDVRCKACDQHTVSDELVVVCPQCGSTDLEVATGEELLLESITLAAAPNSGSSPTAGSSSTSRSSSAAGSSRNSG
jgi:hydrogenase nickel incorporation protein HypA/HybF